MINRLIKKYFGPIRKTSFKSIYVKGTRNRVSYRLGKVNNRIDYYCLHNGQNEYLRESNIILFIHEKGIKLKLLTWYLVAFRGYYRNKYDSDTTLIKDFAEYE